MNINASHQSNQYVPPTKKSMYEKTEQAIQQPALYNQNQDRYKQENRISTVTMDSSEGEALKAITARKIFDAMLQSAAIQIKASHQNNKPGLGDA